MHLRSIDQCHSGCAQSSGWGPPRQQAAAQARVDSRANLTIQTAEGDKITISVGAQSRVAARGGSAEASSRTAVRIDVQGSLSEAELADIGELIDALAAAKQNPSAAPDLSGLDTLAGFDFRYQESVRAGAILRLQA